MAASCVVHRQSVVILQVILCTIIYEDGYELHLGFKLQLRAFIRDLNKYPDQTFIYQFLADVLLLYMVSLEMHNVMHAV